MYSFRVFVVNVLVLSGLLFCLEMSFRAYNAIAGKGSNDGYVIDDDRYGWVHNIRFKERTVKNKCGEDVLMKTPQNKLIIKYPIYKDAEKTILFIGDSYTHAHEVSAGKAYYDTFEELGEGKYRVFAAAVGGFGTLQEFMILEEVYENIRPDYVIWQMCSNDIANNVFELDNASFFNNQRPRPYYEPETETILIKNPGFWMFDVSHVFRHAFLKIVALDWSKELGLLNWLNRSVSLNSEEHEYYRKNGFKIVDLLLEKAVTKYSNTKFIGFSTEELYNKEFGEIFVKNGADYWEDFPKFMNDQENTNCLPLDAHWNHYGNVVAGEKLFELFTKLMENNKK